MRLMTFAKNLVYINKHNEEAAQGKHTFTLGVNKYADLTNDEWRQTLLGMDVYKPKVHQMKSKASRTDIPDSVDWREEVRDMFKNTLYFI